MDKTPEFKDGDDALAWMEARLDGSWVDQVNPAPKVADSSTTSGVDATTATSSTGHSVAQVPHDLDEEEFKKMMGF